MYNNQTKTASESVEQRNLIAWASLFSREYPELELLYHIPNGGSRNKLEAVNLKKQGVKAGVPDLCLPVARGNYNGFYIEMKANKNKPTEKQLWWLSRLSKQGYFVKVCYGWEQASQELLKYLMLNTR